MMPLRHSLIRSVTQRYPFSVLCCELTAIQETGHWPLHLFQKRHEADTTSANTFQNGEENQFAVKIGGLPSENLMETMTRATDHMSASRVSFFISTG
jgi:hypothetical protein